jgi:hypothetical protein
VATPTRRPQQLYVYALLAQTPARTPRGLTVLRAGRFYAAVSRGGPTMTPNPASLTRHDQVVRALQRSSDALLPARFGTLVDSARALAEMLDPVAKPLVDALALVRGREQMTLRLYGAALPARAVPVLKHGLPGTRYLLGLVAKQARAREVPELEPYRPYLSPLIRAERAERHEKDLLVASVYHLVDRGGARAYLAAVERAAGVGKLRLKATGPFPPYAFAPEVP